MCQSMGNESLVSFVIQMLIEYNKPHFVQQLQLLPKKERELLTEIQYMFLVIMRDLSLLSSSFMGIQSQE